MLRFIALSLLAVGVGAAAADGRLTATQLEADFDLGLHLQSCLASKCQIFKGYIDTDEPKHGQPMSIHVEEVLHGPPVNSTTIAVPYESEVSPDALGLAALWRGVETRKGSRVTVALVLERGLFTVQSAGEPAVVTSSERTARLVETFLREHRETVQGASLAGAVASLAKTVDPVLAGYLVERLNFDMLWSWPGLSENRTELFSTLIGSPSIPVHYSRRFCGDLARTYPDQVPSRQAAIVQRLLELTRDSESLVAEGAVSGIAQVLQADGQALRFLPPSVGADFRRTYQQLVTKGVVGKDDRIDNPIR